jgi:hypothetical protein
MSFKTDWILLIPLLQAISHIFEISEDDHPLKIVGHARDHWWTLDFANAFVSPGVNSRWGLVPSPRAYARNGAPRRWLGIKLAYTHALNYFVLFQNLKWNVFLLINSKVVIILFLESLLVSVSILYPPRFGLIDEQTYWSDSL